MSKMNRTQHLLVILAEESGEIVQDVAKALRFGLHDVAPGTSDDNLRKIEREVAQLIEVAKMLRLKIREEDKIDKRKRVLKFLDYSRKVGTLVD